MPHSSLRLRFVWRIPRRSPRSLLAAAPLGDLILTANLVKEIEKHSTHLSVCLRGLSHRQRRLRSDLMDTLLPPGKHDMETWWKTGGGDGLNKRASLRGVPCPASSGMPSLCPLLPVYQMPYKRTGCPTPVLSLSVPICAWPISLTVFCPSLSPLSLPSWLCSHLSTSTPSPRPHSFPFPK